MKTHVFAILRRYFSVVLTFTGVTVLLCIQMPVSAQKLPDTSRTVFKCDVSGKTVYSDSPCLGAQKIDVEPTRGFNKSTGRELIGKDVRREQSREAMADAIRPITGMDAKQLETQGRRMKLASSAQNECQRLDTEIFSAEKTEKLAKRQVVQDIQTQLLTLRKQYDRLGC